MFNFVWEELRLRGVYYETHCLDFEGTYLDWCMVLGDEIALVALFVIVFLAFYNRTVRHVMLLVALGLVALFSALTALAGFTVPLGEVRCTRGTDDRPSEAAAVLTCSWVWWLLQFGQRSAVRGWHCDWRLLWFTPLIAFGLSARAHLHSDTRTELAVGAAMGAVAALLAQALLTWLGAAFVARWLWARSDRELALVPLSAK